MMSAGFSEQEVTLVWAGMASKAWSSSSTQAPHRATTEARNAAQSSTNRLRGRGTWQMGMAGSSWESAMDSVGVKRRSGLGRSNPNGGMGVGWGSRVDDVELGTGRPA